MKSKNQRRKKEREGFLKERSEVERNLEFERVSGDNNEEEIPVPMPNTEVKLLGAEDTCELPCWENRKLPDFYIPR